MSLSNKALLIILDGWGLSPATEGNAPFLAKTPVLDYLYSNYPRMTIAASGLEVGLSRGEMGNSEVGHLNIGAGRVVWQSLARIDHSIEKGDFEKNPVLLKTLKSAKNSKLHLIGLVSSGGVHSNIKHLFALLEAAKSLSVKNVYIHFISDGRDTSPNTAANFARELEKGISKIGVGKIATLVGRYFAMDRDKHWDRTAKAYNLFIKGEGSAYKDIYQAIKTNYQAGRHDEFILPAIFDANGLIGDGETIIFYNFRSERMRQLVEHFITGKLKLTIATMTRYEKTYPLPVMYEPADLKNTLADVLEKNAKTQHHIAETEKYAHVTYFFNGGRETSHKGEVQTLVKSPKVATYDLKPEMSAYEIADKTVGALEKQADFVVVNFANGDMVGHSGILQAAIVACEAIDKCLGKILSKASILNYNAFLTADHGNCEMMIDPATHKTETEHSNSPVPFVLMNFSKKPFVASSSCDFKKEDFILYSSEPCRGILADVATTVLGTMQVKKPSEMEGTDLTKET